MIIGWIKDKLIAILGILLICSVLGATITAKLYLESQKSLASLTEQYRESQRVLGECTESKAKLLKSKTATEDVVLVNQEKLAILQNEKDTYLSQLAKLKSKQCQTTQTRGVQDVQDNEVQLDGSLGTELTSLLDKVYKRGSVDTPSR